MPDLVKCSGFHQYMLSRVEHDEESRISMHPQLAAEISIPHLEGDFQRGAASTNRPVALRY